ncbi:hypothetical protein ACOMHN_020347 [Nucella lapillus]
MTYLSGDAIRCYQCDNGRIFLHSSFDDVIFQVTLYTATSDAIRCYQCDNAVSPSCGNDFKMYQFEATECDPSSPDDYKCGKQEQQPIESEDGWVGVIRTCYHLGHLEGINETNGCHHWYNPNASFTALYCFCDRDFCNAATPLHSSSSSFLLFWLSFLLALLFPSSSFSTPFSFFSSSFSSSLLGVSSDDDDDLLSRHAFDPASAGCFLSAMSASHGGAEQPSKHPLWRKRVGAIEAKFKGGKVRWKDDCFRRHRSPDSGSSSSSFSSSSASATTTGSCGTEAEVPIAACPPPISAGLFSEA